MGRFKFKDKHLDYKKKGDKIEVKLMDESFEIFYKKNVCVNDKSELKQMVLDLRNYGVDLTKLKREESWF